jgi:hypothetical protein
VGILKCKMDHGYIIACHFWNSLIKMIDGKINKNAFGILVEEFRILEEHDDCSIDRNKVISYLNELKGMKR